MKRSCVAFVILLFALTTMAEARQSVSLYGGKLTFSLPTGFAEMSREMLAAKFPGQRPPQHAYGNTDGTVSASVTSSPSGLTPAQLPGLLESIPAMLDNRGTYEWKAKEMVTIKGQKWFRLEFISQARDTKIHNEMLGTSVGGELLVINLNSTVGMFPKYKSKLKSLRSSLRVKP